MRILVVGCGYVGLPLAVKLERRGHDVFGVRRSAVAEKELLESGIQPLVADITEPDTLDRLPSKWDWVVNCVSSSGGEAEAYRKVYLEGTRNLLHWLARSPPGKFVYTSSTSVYGQEDSSIVNEASPTVPKAATAQILVETEKLLLSRFREGQFPAIILRVSGIYGPGRGYWLKQLMSGEAKLDGDGSRILNMVHREDVVGAVIAALELGQPGQVYNVSDDEPVSQMALLTWLSHQLGKKAPALSQADAQPRGKRGVSSKRVSNLRLKTELRYRLVYPTFREGYLSLLP